MSTNLIFKYLVAEGQHIGGEDPRYKRICLTPDGEHLAQEGLDGSFHLDGEPSSLEEAFPIILGEGLRSRMQLLAAPRSPEALMTAFSTTTFEEDFIRALGGAIYREVDCRGETTLLREAREGGIPSR